VPRYCPRCRRENSEHANYCSNCGESMSAPFQGFKKNDLLDTRYEVICTIKSGAMGCVLTALDRHLGTVVAIKQMICSHTDADEIRYAEERFRQEAEILASLHHGGLPKVTDFFITCDQATDRTAHYLVMTFIEGKDLESIIEERGSPPYPLMEVLDYFHQITDILHYLHRHNPPIIYRDLNPRNVMLHQNRLFLVDFGIARKFSPHMKGTAIGTPGYASPEQYRGAAEPRSDLYSLGALVHYLLTGNDPESGTGTLFVFEPPRNCNQEVPPGLERLIMSMVDIVSTRRPASAGEVKERLLKIMKKNRFRNFDDLRRFLRSFLRLPGVPMV